VAILSDLRKLFLFQESLSPSVKAKLNLIDALHEKVMVHHFAKEKLSICESDFDEHLRNLQANLEELSGFWKAAAPKGVIEWCAYYSQRLGAAFPEGALEQVEVECKGKGDRIWMAVKFMANLSYEPLTNLAYLAVMLYALWVYWGISRYSGRNEPFLEVSDDEILTRADFEAALELSLAKLAYQVGIETSSIRQWGRRELTRTKKSTQAKKEITDKRKGIVIAIYEHGQKIASGTKFSIVYKVIKDQFNYHQKNQDKDCYLGVIPKDMKPPNRDTLKLWFSKEGILERDFKKDGGLLITQT
jgi:hypothetical protein